MGLFSKKKTKNMEIRELGSSIIRKYSRGEYEYFSKEMMEIFHEYIEKYQEESERIDEDVVVMTYKYVSEALYEDLSLATDITHKGMLGVREEALYSVWYRCLCWRREQGEISSKEYETMISEIEQRADFDLR